MSTKFVIFLSSVVPVSSSTARVTPCFAYYTAFGIVSAYLCTDHRDNTVKVL